MAVKTVGVVGCGLMGAGIAQVCAEASYRVIVREVSDDLVKKGVHAGKLIGQLAPIVGGRGGGRPELAQAGGKDASKIDDVLRNARELLSKE